MTYIFVKEGKSMVSVLILSLKITYKQLIDS